MLMLNPRGNTVTSLDHSANCDPFSCLMVSICGDMVQDTHVKEYWLIVSVDLKHDVHFVHDNTITIIKPELTKLGCIIKTLHQRTDGCAGQ